MKPLPLAGDSGRICFWLYAKTGKPGDSVSVQFRLRDARGALFVINTSQDIWSSLKIPSESWTQIESYPLNARDLDALPSSVGRFVGKIPSGGAALPVFPVSLVGIDFTTTGNKFQILEVRNPIYTTLDRRLSRGYWQADGRCLTVEETGIASPFLVASDYAESNGSYRIYAALTRAADGAPVATKVGDFSIDSSDIPSFQAVELPLLSPGTYRLKSRVWRLEAGKPIGEYRERNSWFLIFRGPENESAVAAWPSEYDRIVIDPKVPSGVYDCVDKLDLPILVSLRGLASGEKSYDLTWKFRHYDRRPIAEGVIPVHRDGGEDFTTSVLLDIPEDDNVFSLEVAISQGGKVIDATTRIIGFKGTGPEQRAIPAERVSPEPGIYLGVTAMGAKFRDDARYARALDAFQHMGIRGIEYAVEWADVEPLPGCFTFAEMDRHLELAARMGFAVMLRLRSEFPRYTIPGWVDADYICQQDGTVSGLLASGPSFSPCDERWVQAYTNFQKTVAARYAGSKAVTGFKVPQNIRESFWIDRPFRYQFTDYSPSAERGYRGFLQARYDGLGEVAEAYGEDITSWEQIRPPTPYADAADLNLSTPWRDWVDYKTEYYNRTVSRVLDGLHANAPGQRLYFYSINALTGPPSRETLLGFERKNAALAAGGSHPVGEIGYARLYPTGYGLNLMPEPNAYAMPSARHADDHAGTALEGSTGHGPRMFSNWPMMQDPRDGSSAQQQAAVRLGAWNRVFQSVPRLRMPQAPVGIVFSWEGMTLGLRGMYSLAFTDVMEKEYRDVLLNRGIESFGADDTFDEVGLAKFPVLVLPPEVTPVVPEELLRRVADYVRDGGTVVMTPESANIDLAHLGKREGLLRALGLAGKEPTDEVPARVSVGKGWAWICRDEVAMRTFLGSDQFLKALEERGGRRFFGSRQRNVTTTLHDGQDGRFYLYVFNGGSEDVVHLSAWASPLGGRAFSLKDILNAGEALPVHLQDAETAMELPLKAKTAGFFEISLLENNE
ncbi:MAG: beta-galactosidase [Verrucomicrobia bacterium]|nr:beta-galactosidase [Verrucomicrobiota bacterium]